MKLNRRNLDKWRGLSWKERRILLSAVFLLPATTFALRFIGFKNTQSILSRLARTDSTKGMLPETAMDAALRTARLLRVAVNNGFYRPTCLPQSLSLWWLLKRQGIECELFIGMQKEADAFKGHAWVEVSGQVLNDHEDISTQYTSMLE